MFTLLFLLLFCFSTYAGLLNWRTVLENETNEEELNEAIYYALEKVDTFTPFPPSSPPLSSPQKTNDNKKEVKKRLHFESLVNFTIRESVIYKVKKTPRTSLIRLWDPFRNSIIYVNATVYDYITLPIVMDRIYSISLIAQLRSGEPTRSVIQKNALATKLPEAPETFLLNLTISKDNNQFFGLTGFQFHELSSPLISIEVQPFPTLYHPSLTTTSGTSRKPLSSASISSSSSQQSNGKKQSIKVMSVNIWNYNYWERRRGVLIREIQKVNPDVIGFQEVRAKKKSPATSSRYQVEDLALSLSSSYPYHYFYEPAMGFEEHDEYVHEGLAIFSSFPILKQDIIELSRNEKDGNDFHQRLCLRALLDTPIGGVNFLTTHLSLSEDARKRTLKEIGEYSKNLNEPVILVGDFNMEMTDGTSHGLKDFGFFDAWEKLHSQKEKRAGYTFNSWELKSRIDYILLKNLNVRSITIEGEEGDAVSGYSPIAGVHDMKNTMYASDHRFLLARIEAEE